MLAWLCSWIVPAFADEDLNRRARLLNVMALTALLLSVAVNMSIILALLAEGVTAGTVIAVITLLVSFLWVGSILFLSRRGRVSAGSHVLLWGAIALALAGNLTDPNANMEDPSWSLLFVIVVAAALLLGTRGTALFAAVGVFLYVGCTLAEKWGWIYRAPTVRQMPNIPYHLALNSGVLIVLAVMGWLFGSGLERALQRARQQAAELAAAKQHLETTQTYLEQTVERTVAEYTAFARRVAAGDLTSRLDLADASNPLFALGQGLNAMVAGLQQVSAQVREAVGELTTVAGGIQAICAQQGDGAARQTTAISDATATITEVRVLTGQSAERAVGVADLSRQTAEVSRSGEQAVAETVDGMGQVKERVGEIAGHILTLAAQMEAIGQIITTVGEVAKHSRLLALNAAVEAARAGEAGQSFAVVAGEMRSLAEQSRQAAERVSGIIVELQQEVTAAVQATEEGVRRADAGVLLAGRAGAAIRQLAEGVAASAQAAAQIAAAAGQQMIGMEQIAGAMENIRQVTAQGLTSTRLAEQSAGELDRLADRLREIVAQYRL